MQTTAALIHDMLELHTTCSLDNTIHCKVCGFVNWPHNVSAQYRGNSHSHETNPIPILELHHAHYHSYGIPIEKTGNKNSHSFPLQTVS